MGIYFVIKKIKIKKGRERERRRIRRGKIRREGLRNTIDKTCHRIVIGPKLCKISSIVLFVN